VEPLSPTTAAALLRASCAAIAAEVRALPAELAARRPADGGWCALEVAGHLVETERRGFAGRIRILLDHDRPRLETWDPASVAEARRDQEREPGALAAELLAAREAGVLLLEGLSTADLARTGDHPEVGTLTVGDVMHEWVHHDRAHLMQLLRLTQGFAWEHMGATRRFSG